VGNLVMGISNVLLYIGAAKRRKLFFLPWLIFEMIGIVLSFLVPIQ
jgi:hypothetical protein